MERIRGLGLAYGYDMYSNAEESLTYFTLYRSTNVVGAFEEGYRIVQEFIDGKSKIEVLSLEAAKSSLAYQVVSRSDTMNAAAWENLRNYLRGVGSGYQKWMLQSIRDATIKDVERVLAQYIIKLFDSRESMLVLTTNPTNVTTVLEGFRKLPHPRKLISISLEKFFSDAKDKKFDLNLTIDYEESTMKLKIRSGSTSEDIIKAIQNRFQLSLTQKSLKLKNEIDKLEYLIDDQLSSGNYRLIVG